MALSDIISRPLTAPLEGFDKAVGVGFELAQKQQQVQIAQQKLELDQEEIKAGYLAKGISALSALPKAKGPAKRALADSAYALFIKGGLTNLDKNQWAILSSDEVLPAFVNVESEAQNLYPNNPKLQNAYIAQRLQRDADEYYKTSSEHRLKEAQLSQELQKQLTVEAAKQAFQSGVKQEERAFETKSKAEEQFGKDLENYGASEEVLNWLNTKTPEQRRALYSGYLSSVGRYKKFAEDNYKNLKDLTPAQQKQLDIARTLFDEASREYPDPEKRSKAIGKATKANGIFGAILSSQKSEEKSYLKQGKESLDLLKSAQDVLGKTLTPELKAKIDGLNQIISTANNPEMRKNPFSGQGALSALGRVNDPRSSIREEEYKRISRESGTALEGVRAAFERAFSGNALTEKQWADLNRVAAFYQGKIKADLEKKIKGVMPRLKRAGITDQEIYSGFADFEEPTFGIVPKMQSGGQEASQKPTASKKGKPSSALVSKSKESFPNDWKQRLQAIGYDIGGL